MGLTLHAFPPGPPPPPPVSDTLLPSSDKALDFFSRVVRPAKDDPKEKEVAAELRNRITEWQGADSEFLKNAETEFDFASGLHWLEEDTGNNRAKDLASMGRTAAVFDLLTPSIDIVVNQIRINKSTAKFVPLAEGADRETAEVRTGLYRNIERVSNAAIARETGYTMAVMVGRGYWRIVIEDEPGPTVRKRLAFKRVDSLHSVAIDPTALDFEYRDAAWAYTFDDYQKDQFIEEFGSDEEGADLDVVGLGLPDDRNRDFWFPKDKVKVGEYFRRKWRRRKVWELWDGREMWSDEAPPEIVAEIKARGGNTDGIVLREVVKSDDYLEWRKMTGAQTLEKRIWPGKLIPIVVCIGREVFRGKRPKIHSGLVRPAMWPSRVNDYMISRLSDEIALSPLPHFFYYTGQVSPEQKNIINDINSKPWSAVEISVQEDKAGRQLPSPHWEYSSANPAAVVQAANVAQQGLMRVLNTYAPQLGQLAADQSGRAVEQVKDQGDLSHAGFSDNYNRAIGYEAEVVSELMDVVYTEKQAITISEPDDTTKQVLINQEYKDEETGQVKKHLFGGSDYGPVPIISPNYPSRMAEAADRMLQLASVPALAPLIARVFDLLIFDLNIPNPERYASRVRPPGFGAPGSMPSQQQLVQQLQQLQMVNDQAHQLIMRLVQKINELGSKESIQKLAIASRERIAAANNAAGVVEAELKAGQLGAMAVLEAQLQAMLKQLDTAQDVQQSNAAEPVAPPAPGAAPAPEAQGAPQLPQPGVPAPTPGTPLAGLQPSVGPPQQ